MDRSQQMKGAVQVFIQSISSRLGSLRKFQLNPKKRKRAWHPLRAHFLVTARRFEMSSDEMHYRNLSGLSVESNINMRIIVKLSCPVARKMHSVKHNKGKKKLLNKNICMKRSETWNRDDNMHGTCLGCVCRSSCPIITEPFLNQIQLHGGHLLSKHCLVNYNAWKEWGLSFISDTSLKIRVFFISNCSNILDRHFSTRN